ncbi:MAG: hypothetical protein PF439_08960 [Helicobacteraceae bacterium]|jgi:hypothetical protein|nr:hypothetical protein [Helicobacteraceae bacterium]
MRYYILASVILGAIFMIGCGSDESGVTDTNDTETIPFIVSYESNNSLYNTRDLVPITIDFLSTTPLNNRGAYVTSQCYTKTVDEKGMTHNPCYACHINSTEPNYVDDADLQESYAFGEYTKTNRFTNLFKDRSALVSQISDEEIVSYVGENNYIQKGHILLADKLQNPPVEWDINSDGKWGGYVPDCYFNFDDAGFDRSPDSAFTGWRAFGYYPFLGTFWPTNGSTDDVLIRLSKEFMLDENSRFDIEVYKLNLSIVEALIKEKDIAIDATDEKKYGVDLNQDGVLNTAMEIVFRWEKPTYDSGTGKITGFSMRYVGLAKVLLVSNEYLIAPGLYPKNTEFLHSVRYIDVGENNQSITMAPRMKELRYAKKKSWITYAELSNATLTDIKEKDAFPARLRTIIGNTEYGALNNIGWIYQGFIEDARGELRPQNYEETQYCIGCHSGIGAIADSTFVFQRKFDKSHFQNGWYHWTQDPNGLKNIVEPKTPDGKDEYSQYLAVNHAGDEFRANDEVMDRFFDANGSLIKSEAEKIKDDISYLLYPSVSRAKELNKAYKVIVEEQSYIYGRDAHVKPVENVHQEVEIDTLTDVTVIRR